MLPFPFFYSPGVPFFFLGTPEKSGRDRSTQSMTTHRAEWKKFSRYCEAETILAQRQRPFPAQTFQDRHSHTDIEAIPAQRQMPFPHIDSGRPFPHIDSRHFRH
ncbi:hypothetical protein CEXT_9321 [Caerostris extrusa]|uniref:Uncharacterized protein n=1 Tax=Caerostris extrusa TaxID=172846 RepID=A0AAV4YDJ8_CAEEX|nr:hypothetical protein CEXT_9321 [Caerostris extrusa]